MRSSGLSFALGFALPPRQRLDQAWALGRVAQHFPNLVNGDFQVVVDVNKRCPARAASANPPASEQRFLVLRVLHSKGSPERRQRPNQATTLRPIWTVGSTD